jgi:hypothetical protein
VYEDENGCLWKDVNLGRGNPSLHSSSSNCFDGEPDIPITGEFEILSKTRVSTDSLTQTNKNQYKKWK